MEKYLRKKYIKIDHKQKIGNVSHAKYVWFECEKDGFTIHGTNDVQSKPFFLKNATRSATFIPRQILNAYNVELGDRVTAAMVGVADMKVFAPLVKMPEYSNKLTRQIETANEKGETIGEVVMSGNNILSLWKKIGIKKDESVIMNLDKRDRTQITLTKVRSSEADYHLEQIKMMYGKNQQYCPYDRLNYLFKAGKAVTIPQWFLSEVFAKDSDAKFRLEKIKNGQYRLVPLCNDQLTGDAIDYCNEIATTIYLAKETVKAKPELLNAVKYFGKLTAVAQTAHEENEKDLAEKQTIERRIQRRESRFGKGVNVNMYMKTFTKGGTAW